MQTGMIETSRLRLRELLPEDEDTLAAWFADDQVMRWIGTGGVRTRDDARRTIERERAAYAAQGYGEWLTILRETGAPIGLCGLIRWPNIEGMEELEVAYLLGRPWWGQGYATEAATAIRDWAHRELGRERLVCLVYHDNVASANVARKLGMTWEKDVPLGPATVAMFSLGPRATSRP